MVAIDRRPRLTRCSTAMPAAAPVVGVHVGRAGRAHRAADQGDRQAGGRQGHGERVLAVGGEQEDAVDVPALQVPLDDRDPVVRRDQHHHGHVAAGEHVGRGRDDLGEERVGEEADVVGADHRGHRPYPSARGRGRGPMPHVAEADHRVAYLLACLNADGCRVVQHPGRRGDRHARQLGDLTQRRRVDPAKTLDCHLYPHSWERFHGRVVHGLRPCQWQVAREFRSPFELITSGRRTGGCLRPFPA